MVETIRVLIVDDSEDDCMVYSRALATNPDVHYVLEEAHDGAGALQCIAASEPNCILLDYSLPGHNGIEVLKSIRADHPFVPVLMLTGQGSEAIAVSAMQQGAQNYICKSAVNPDYIHRAIQLAISHCNMEKGLHEQRISLEIFTRALAHDLKEPVRTVKSFLKVLADTEPLSLQGRTYFDYVQSATDRMVALIEAVYDYTRLDATAPKSKRQVCSVSKLLQEAKDDIAGLVAERNATVQWSSMPNVAADPARLRQVFQNLICNAIHHAPNDPVITISVEQRADQWCFAVTDNGPGIEPDLRERVFEPFSRMSSRNAKGLGMGLAICRRIVESHGGRIWCEAAPEGGAKFCFLLPRSATETGTADREKTAVPAISSGLPEHLATVLVVDDNQAAIELARIMLVQQAHLRCNILSAQSGDEALSVMHQQAAQGDKVDIVLLDINMPRMDGFEVLERVAADHDLPRPAVVMCTTSCYDKDIERAHALGAAGYLEKPPCLETLKPLIGEMDGLCLQEDTSGATLLRVA